MSYTNGYAPLEQMEQNLDKFGPWTDFYALGATLYTLLTSKKPPLPSDINEDKSPDKHVALPMPPQISAATKSLVLWLITIIVTPQQPQQPGETPPTPPIPKRNNRKKWIVSIAAIAVMVVVGVVLEVLNAEKSDSAKENFGSYSTEILADETITVNGVSFVMKGVQGGVFTMGATSEQGSDAWDSEKPVHHVAVSSFRIGQTEVTQALWKAVMGTNPSYIKGDYLPVEEVSWEDCQEFISKLNSLTGKAFRLPTEAEWEYAARGGNKSQGYKYSGSNNLDKVGWYEDNSGSTTHEVATKSPNELGLYDMSGNVEEWCFDWDGDYSSNAQTDPTGPSSGSDRVSRGGSWGGTAYFCRVSYRSYGAPGDRYIFRGFRLAS